MEKAAIDELISKARKHQTHYGQLVAEDERIERKISDLQERRVEIGKSLPDIEQKYESMRDVLSDYNVDIGPLHSDVR